jgi:hypothetical protein
MVLPRLGGTPAVWNTCMVFFQAVLLAGYAYAHGISLRLGRRLQLILHLALLLLPFLVLPIVLSETALPPETGNPIPWLLGLLTVTVGLPFFMVSTNGPLLQQWFAGTGHPAAKDPYFLYGASNLGSMLALLAYPVLIEPTLPLAGQTDLWRLGYGLLVLLMAGCAVASWRGKQIEDRGSRIEDRGSRIEDRGSRIEDRGKKEMKGARPKGGSPSILDPRSSILDPRSSILTQRLRWVALAFVPSSLMLSVTTYLTTDIAAVPLLWVIPLALYLLTFILVFARKPLLPHAALVRIQPLAILLLTLVMLSEATALEGLPVWPLLALHLTGFFIVAMVCHGELVRSRPPAERLTEFYLWLAVGGVLGGLFNSLLAPLVFPTVTEYPLVLVLACLLRPAIGPLDDNRVARRLDLVLPVGLGLLTLALVLLGQAYGITSQQVRIGLMFGLPAVLCYTFMQRPIRFGLGIAALFLASICYHGVHGTLVYRQRSFFGVHRVTEQDNARLLVHGNTIHGRQSLDPARRREPLAYFHRTGPIGQVFATFSGSDAKRHVAIVGLGAGSLAAYAESGLAFKQEFTYYEIDPAVIGIAQNYFTFLSDSAAEIKIVPGDARLTLAHAPAYHYGLLIMDAFSSDAIPLHLLTKQALAMYLEKLADDGVLAFHISNRYLDLEPVLGDLAKDAKLVCLARHDLEISDEEKAEGKAPSIWLVMARHREDLHGLARAGGWRTVQGRGGRVWTDDYSNLISVFQWK